MKFAKRLSKFRNNWFFFCETFTTWEFTCIGQKKHRKNILFWDVDRQSVAKVFLEVRRRRRGKKKKKKKVEAPLAIRSGASYESRTTNEAIINHKRAGSLGRPYIYLKKKEKKNVCIYAITASRDHRFITFPGEQCSKESPPASLSVLISIVEQSFYAVHRINTCVTS